MSDALRADEYEDNEHIPVTVLSGLEIALEDLWARLA